MAASAMTFARYVRELGHVPLAEGVLSALVLAALTLVNALGVRAGAGTQHVLMVLKIAANPRDRRGGMALMARPAALPPATAATEAPAGFGAAMVPVLFAYGGWQTAAFVGGEVKDPRARCRAAWCWAWWAS
jgi:APA family basic amino acid/polyamine antiporter